MTKYELSLAADYVPSWGIVEAIRELFQNALDEETADPNNKMFFQYPVARNGIGGILQIGNKNSTLDIKTLLIGSTTKQEDKYIGQHGEGYKLATIVLLRTGHEVTFYNYNAREIWHPRLVKSRRYQGALVPTFFVEKQPIWTKPEHSLIIEISNVSQEEYNLITQSNLHLQVDSEAELGLQTQYGTILTDDKYKGKVFVSGLFVCDSKAVEYGYDFKPAVIKLDRDRRLVDTFDLCWQTSRLIAATKDIDLIQKALKINDGKYINYHAYSTDIRDAVATSFKSTYGLSMVPVSTNEEFNALTAKGYKAVMVTEAEQKLIKASEKYSDPAPVDKTLLERIEDWWITIQNEGFDTLNGFVSFEPLLEELRGVL